MASNLSSVLVQEQKRYTLRQLSSECHVQETDIVPIIRKLKEYGVLKTVRARDEQRDMSELLDDDVTVADVDAGDNSYYYVFTFVGVIVVCGFVFLSYPKYIKHSNPVSELKLIIKVLEKYNSESEIVRLFNETNDSKAFNLLAILLFFVRDYHENGSYHNSEVVIETNGQGSIRWDKTINETFAMIFRNRPFYTELQTIKRADNDFDYFKRLHECIITRASYDLQKAGLLDLFELSGTSISDESIEDFGDTDYILYRINRELSVQYNSWKQLILKALYAFVDNSGHLTDTDSFSIFGTTSFNLVWERVCSAVLNDKLKIPLKSFETDLPKPLLEKYCVFEGNLSPSLLSLIEKPCWTFPGVFASETLRPDIIAIERVGNRYMFVIIDAKYYTPKLEAGVPPKNQPGIESITKQYLYQLAYSGFIKDQGFSSDDVKNCFVLPTENPEEVEKGSVCMKMFNELNTEPKLKDIQIRFLLASSVYRFYLNSRKMNLDVLKL